MAWKKRALRLPAPYLKRVVLRADRVADWGKYPFNLPWLRSRSLEFTFERPITIVVGENGTGKSTFLEALARLVGFDGAEGGPGYMPVDHSRAIEVDGAGLAKALTASWLPKIGAGWFFRAESFYSIARYLDTAAIDANEAPPGFLSHSHGESFLRFFEERCQQQGIYIFDEPESALSPRRQMEFLKLLQKMERSTQCQVIMATHSPLLMAYPNAAFFALYRRGCEPSSFQQTPHFDVMRRFFADPEGFLGEHLDEPDAE